MNIKNKRKRLSVRIGFVLGLEIFVLLSILVIVMMNISKSSVTSEYIASAQALVRSGAKTMNQRNSRSMQQLRLYTLSDVALSSDFNTQNCVEWLRSHKKLRYQDFKSLYYCDLSTGMAYSDEGDVKNLTETEYFKRIKADSLSQYISNPIGTNSGNTVYYVCKTINKNKKPVGFLVQASDETLAKAVTDINIDGEGYPILQEVQKLKMSSDVMNESVRNMVSSTDLMSETGERLKYIVIGMKDSISKIGTQIDNFEV